VAGAVRADRAVLSEAGHLLELDAVRSEKLTMTCE
jgi:hypothetical protein